MKDSIKDYDTALIITLIILSVTFLSFFGEITDTLLLFFTNLVAYIMGEKIGKNKI